ncbi:DarT ssDNA thymidine ADP-ribosyltransferase family protein [Tardiphaga sp. vice352]|uniref:DarT ssDNA thymidine ADP-ribosyltransferase family protein n=1 Tax=Tardiphaga sp. vice352 TaxID=2592816 RepID=UPI00143D699C|nr:DarT ssDNA thymidine ADP-ribosyltransferase family protein [Tardiphaga sp. vice352]
MSITLDRANRHIVDQERRLAANKQRAFWPSYLFHTTHITNAVEIVGGGALNCRNQIAGFHDVANQGALAAYEASHDYARLYFRPKNGFHMRTEGIKCLNDPYRLQNQMSIPVCFVFRLADVLCREDACFSSGNVQRSHDFKTGNDSFDELDFDAIYHDSWTDQFNRQHIHDCRMAEVSVRDKLKLEHGLQAILFRTSWDLETFRFYIAEKGIACPHRLGIEQIHGSLFMSEGLYITDLNFSDDRVQMSFHFPLRNVPPDKTYDVCVVQQYAGGSAKLDKPIVLDKPSLSIKNFRPEADSVWTIFLEKELAFRAKMQHAKSELFG